MGIKTDNKFMKLLQQILLPSISTKEEQKKAQENIEVPIFVHNSKDFNVGMTRADAKNMKKSIFIDYVKTFDKIDSPPDGILSKKELKYAAENNKETVKNVGLKSAFVTVGTLFSNALIKKDSMYGLAKGIKAPLKIFSAIFGAATLYYLYTFFKADKVSKQYD